MQEARPTLTFLTRVPPPILTCRPTHALARSDCWQSQCKAKDNDIFLHIWDNDIVQYPDVTLDVVAIPQNTSELKGMHFVCSSHKCSWSAKSTTLSSVRLWHSGVSDKALTSEM